MLNRISSKEELSICEYGGLTGWLPATVIEINKGLAMNFRNWETIIQKMSEDFHLQSKESGRNLVLIEWRKSLAKEPHVLKPFQIDEIVREVRKRVTSAQEPVGSTNSGM